MKKMVEYVLGRIYKMRLLTRQLNIFLIILASGAGTAMITYLFLNFFNYHQHTKFRVIHYNNYQQVSINAQSWFENFVEHGDNNEWIALNKGFVEKTCKAIKEGKYTFEWNYIDACKLVERFNK